MIHPPFERAKSLSDLPGIRHGFFGRRCGNEDDQGFGLDTSETLTGDLNRIAVNRRIAMTASGLGALPLAALTQIHSTNVVVVDQTPSHDERPRADGLVTAHTGVALGILTADCTPVLFADIEAGIIGACHAGWKGAVGGIIGNMVNAMIELGASTDTMIAAIGPTISGTNYEVGPEFSQEAIALNPDTSAHIYIPDGGTREHFDLPGFVTAEMARNNIAHVASVGGSTYAQPTRYFSHRHFTQKGGTAGRQISLIGRLA